MVWREGLASGLTSYKDELKDCEDTILEIGVCVSDHPERETVEQGRTDMEHHLGPVSAQALSYTSWMNQD